MNNYIASNKIFYHPDRTKAFVDDTLVRPVSVKMRLTDECNLKCYYCSYKDNLNSGDIKFKDALTVLGKLNIMGVKSIVFTGGEPTCYYSFRNIVRATKEMYGFDIGLITNGVLYPNALEFLTWIRFSLDTVDKNIYKEIKGMDNLGRVMKNIKKVAADRPKGLTVGAQAVINEYNFDYKFDRIIDAIKFAASVGLDYFQIRPLENHRYSQVHLDIIDGLIKSLKQQDLGIKVIFTEYKWQEIKNGYSKRYEGCPSANFIGSVDVKGDYYMCCAMINDETACYGNLITEGADEILSGRKYIQESFNYGKCTLACQGSLLNQVLANFKNIEHINFI